MLAKATTWKSLLYCVRQLSIFAFFSSGENKGKWAAGYHGSKNLSLQCPNIVQTYKCQQVRNACIFSSFSILNTISTFISKMIKVNM